jgi:hypothetical protein
MMPITDWCWIRPRLLALLFPVDAVTRAAVRRITYNNPRAIIAFHPQLEAETASFANPHHVRVIPALLQAQPPLLQLFVERGPSRDRAGALLKDWWNQRRESLARNPMFHRLLLTINLHVDESTGAGGRLMGVDFLPGTGVASATRKAFWLKRACSWLRLAYERVYAPPKLILPTPSYCVPGHFKPLLTSNHRRSLGERQAYFPRYLFAREEGRMQLRHRLEATLSRGEESALTLDEYSARAYPGIFVRARKAGEQVAFEFTFEESASLASAPHPLSALLPSLDGGHCYVDTRTRKDAEPVFVDSRLSGPKFAADRRDAKTALLGYLGRTIIGDDEASGDSFGRRYVEPGVGRAYLVDFLRIDGRPEFADFSIIGGGLTPYARGGYVDVGRPIDGKVAIGRAWHRKRCADRLEEVGSRTAPVVAIIALKADHIELPNGERPLASLLVRGFRSVLRIKQLDPVACLYHGFQARPKLVSFLTDPRWNLCEEKRPRPSIIREEQLFSVVSDRHGVSGVLPRLTSGNLAHFNRFNPNLRARQCRSRATRLYSPFLVDMIKTRVAMEIGRDPVHEPLTNLEYALWFASTMGRQLAIFRRASFLHDYHQEGISTSNKLPWWLYSLGENNITLMAEFPDLDTGIFVDAPDDGSVEELHLTRKDLAILSSGFDRFHRREVLMARSAVCTLATIVCYGQSVAIEPVLRCFEAEYATTLRSAS